MKSDPSKLRRQCMVWRLVVVHTHLIDTYTTCHKASFQIVPGVVVSGWSYVEVGLWELGCFKDHDWLRVLNMIFKCVIDSCYTYRVGMGFRHIFPNTGRKAGKQNDGVVKKLLPVFQKQNGPSLSCLPNRFQPDYSQTEHSAYGTLDKDMDDTDIARHGCVPTQELQDTQSVDNATSVSDCSGRESSSDGSKEYSQESIMEKAAVVRDRNLNTESPKGGIALPLTNEHIKSPIKVTQVSTCVLKSSRCISSSSSKPSTALAETYG